jgi:hypothetical protein
LPDEDIREAKEAFEAFLADECDLITTLMDAAKELNTVLVARLTSLMSKQAELSAEESIQLVRLATMIGGVIGIAGIVQTMATMHDGEHALITMARELEKAGKDGLEGALKIINNGGPPADPRLN